MTADTEAEARCEKALAVAKEGQIKVVAIAMDDFGVAAAEGCNVLARIISILESGSR